MNRMSVLAVTLALVFAPVIAGVPTTAGAPGPVGPTATDAGPSIGGGSHSALADPGAGLTAAVDEEEGLVGGDTGFRNELVYDGLSQPVTTTFLPDGRMLLLQKGGEILIGDPTSDSPALETYLSLEDVQTDGEKGLLGIALDPEFESNNHLYLYYVNKTTERQRVSRFTHEENDGGLTSRANRSSEYVVWNDTETWTDCCHYGGGLDFGPDDRLYLTLGDESLDAGMSAQNLSRTGGKVLRFNPDGSVPTTNPFVDDSDALDEIWAYGLRNPFRARWDLPTERFFIGEVGGDDYATSTEDVHLGEAGANYGWPYCEGNCENDSFTDPIFNYPHDGSDASITGGFVYRDGNYPEEFEGAYFYGDYVRGWIRYLTFDGPETVEASHAFEPDAGAVVHLTQGPDGALYYVDIQGSVRRITFADDNPPTITDASATPTNGTAPLTVTFNASATDDSEFDLDYEWTFGDGTGDAERNTTHTYDEPGVYEARLSVSDTESTVRSDPIEIAVGNPPNVTISAPENGETFIAGDTIHYEGSATDPEDGVIDPANLTWEAVLYHSNHTHPFHGPVSNTTNGSFDIPTSGHDYTGDTGHTISLTATDSDGLSTTERVRIEPVKSDMTYDTDPSGLTLEVDTLPRTTPVTVSSIVNFTRSLSAPETQCVAGTEYTFANWSDGGERVHSFSVPDEPTTFTAAYNTTGTCNEAPSLDPISDVDLERGETRTIEVGATDPEDDPITLSASGLPDFASFTDDGDGSGTISFTPESDDNGTYEFTVTASDGNKTDSQSATATVIDPDEEEGSVIARVNAGGSEITDAGLDWVASEESDAVSGGTSSSTNDGIAFDDSVPDDTPVQLFQTELYGGMDWSFPVEAGETYEVSLHFAEIDPGKESGERVFDVLAENETVLSNVDIYAAVGEDTGMTRTVSVTPDDDVLDLSFEGVVGKPKISAVSVVAPPDTDPSPTIEAPERVTVPEETVREVAVSASDPAGDDVSLAVDGPDFVALDSDGGEGMLTVAPGTDDAGEHQVTVSATDASQTVTENVTVFVSDASASAVTRVNAGGGEIAVDGPNWLASNGTYVTGGNAVSTTDAIAFDGSVPSGTPEAMFQSELYQSTDWSFPTQAGETYEVRLYFAEIDGEKGVDNRLIDATIEGEQMLDGYDIYADVGADVGTMRAYTVTPDETLDVSLTATKDYAKVSGVAIVNTSAEDGIEETNAAPSASFTTNVSTPTVNETVGFDASGSSDSDGSVVGYEWRVDGEHTHDQHGPTLTHTFESAGEHTVSLTVTDDDGATNSTMETITVEEDEGDDGLDDTTEAVARVNAGGSTVTGDSTWMGSDGTYVSGGITSSTSDSITLSGSVPAGTPEVLFQSELYGETDWSFPVAAGETYDVVLHFAEIDGEKGDGNRVFDVLAENETVLSNVDIYAEVGADVGITKTVTVTPDDDTLSLSFEAISGNPKVSAVAVVPSDGTEETNAAPSASFTTNVSTPTVNETVEFDASGSSDSDGTVASYEWLIEGDAAGTSETLTHTFESAGEHTVSLTVTDDDGATNSTMETITVEESDGSDDTTEAIARINAGGGTVTGDSTWTGSDGTYVSGGSTASTTDSITLSGSVPAGTPEALFQSELYGETDWSFPVTAGETYDVVFHFAEIDGAKGDGNRVFNVVAEDEIVLSNVDIYAEVGENVGMTKTVTVTPDDDVLDLSFEAISGNPKVSAIAVVPSDGTEETNTAPSASFTANVSTPTVNETVEFDATESSDSDGSVVGYEWRVDGDTAGTGETLTHTFESAGEHTVSLTVTDDDGATNSTMETITVEESDGSDDTTEAVMRVNAGGGTVTGDSTWMGSDGTYVSGGITSSTSDSITLSDSVPAGTPEALFQSELYGEMDWSIPVEAGQSYDVVLHFAEIDGEKGDGNRVFDVFAENETVLSNVDIYAAVGADTGMTRTVSVTPDDDVLDLSFEAIAGNPKVSAVAVVPSDGTEETNTAVSASFTTSVSTPTTTTVTTTPTPTPAPTSTPTPTQTATPIPTLTSTPTVTATTTPTVTTAPTPTPTVTTTPTVTPTQTGTAVPPTTGTTTASPTMSSTGTARNTPSESTEQPGSPTDTTRTTTEAGVDSTEETQIIPNNGTPGFTLTAAFVGIGAAFLLLVRRRE